MELAQTAPPLPPFPDKQFEREIGKMGRKIGTCRPKEIGERRKAWEKKKI